MPELSTGQVVNAGQRCYAILELGTLEGPWDVLSEMLTGSTPNATDNRRKIISAGQRHP